jgi:hypothetical protein
MGWYIQLLGQVIGLGTPDQVPISAKHSLRAKLAAEELGVSGEIGGKTSLIG